MKKNGGRGTGVRKWVRELSKGWKEEFGRGCFKVEAKNVEQKEELQETLKGRRAKTRPPAGGGR